MFLNLLPLISVFLYGNLIVKYRLDGGSHMSVVIPSVSTVSGILYWVVLSSYSIEKVDFREVSRFTYTYRALVYIASLIYTEQ